MQCQECGSENTTGTVYCHICGSQLKLTYDQIHSSVSKDIAEHREKTTEENTRQILVATIFFFMCSLIFRNLGADPPTIEVYPSYISDKARIAVSVPSFFPPTSVEKEPLVARTGKTAGKTR